MKYEHTYGEKMARNGRTKVIYKGTFSFNQSLFMIYHTELKFKKLLLRSCKDFEPIHCESLSGIYFFIL